MKTIPRAIIFDWDNTLVDSWDAIAHSINHVLAAFGRETWTPTEIRARCTRSAREIFPVWFGEDWEKAYEIYYRHFGEARKSLKINVLPGAEELLRWLKVANIPTFIVSNKNGEFLRQEIAALGWENLFAGIAGATDAKTDKPSREVVDFALAKASLTADETIWFVGDTEVDMLCAKNSGCTPVFIGDAQEALRLSVAQSFPNCYELGKQFYR